MPIKKQTAKRLIAALLKRGELDLAVHLSVEAQIEVLGRRPTRQQWRKIYRRRGPIYRKRLYCCTRPVVGRTRRNKTVWFAKCRYKYLSGPRKGQFWTTKRIRGKDIRKRPPRAKDDMGRVVKTCKESPKVNTKKPPKR